MLQALVVEDDENSLTALAALAEREGFTTAGADTLKAARAHLATTLPDVLLVDLKLPGGSGLDLLKDLNGAANSRWS